MLHFGRLSYYALPSLSIGDTVPHWLTVELGLLAGRLYIDFSEYDPLTRYLHAAVKTQMETGQNIRGRVGFTVENVTKFLLEWLTLRRQGQDIMHTPMGYVCQGRILHKSHPFFAERRQNLETPSPSTAEDTGIEEGTEKDEDLESDPGSEKSSDD